MIVRTMTVVTALLALVIAAAPVSAVSILLDDFEKGVGAWRTNDARVAGAAPSDICGIYTIARQADGRTQQAALVEFLRANNTWASVSLPIDGAVWVRQNVGQITFWVRGDGSSNTVDLTIRSKVGEERRDVSYVYKLPLNSTEWQHRAVRVFGFQDEHGNTPTAEALRNAYLLQLVKTGSWPTLSLQVDEMLAEPIPGWEQPAEGPAPLATRLDFTLTSGRLLGQLGVNLGDELAPILDDRGSSAAIARALEQLTPCVVRMKLSDFYDARAKDYDLIGLNRAINWATDTGARTLVCLDPARVPDANGDLCPDPNFTSVALKLVSLRRGGPHLRYYELFDRPLLTGQFPSTSALVAAYNDLARRVLLADPEARVGGPGFASAWESNLREFLTGAQNLHFLSLHFYGAHSATVGDATIYEAALGGATADLPSQLSLMEVRELAQSLQRPMPELFVTSLAMNSARRPDGTPADERISENAGAAWTAAALLSSTCSVDKALHYKLFGIGWGLLNSRGVPNPSFHAAWLLHTYAPRGATLCEFVMPSAEVLIAAIWTPTARNAFVVHMGDGARTVVIEAAGVGTPVSVRERRLTSSGEMQMADLPKSATQSVEFNGPGVAVIQFIGGE
jgi:hypothetical protein